MGKVQAIHSTSHSKDSTYKKKGQTEDKMKMFRRALQKAANKTEEEEQIPQLKPSKTNRDIIEISEAGRNYCKREKEAKEGR